MINWNDLSISLQFGMICFLIPFPILELYKPLSHNNSRGCRHSQQIQLTCQSFPLVESRLRTALKWNFGYLVDELWIISHEKACLFGVNISCIVCIYQSQYRHLFLSIDRLLGASALGKIFALMILSC